jgi:hypothetical protein
VRFTLHRSARTQPGVPADSTHAVDDALWPAQARGRRISLAPLTTLMSVALIALLGLWGGAELQKHQGAGATSAAASGAAGGFAGRFGGGARPGGATGTGAGAATGGVTVGTVTVVSGKTLYLTSSSGAIVKATLTGSTTYSRNAKATKAGIKPGDTAIVQGATNSAGVVVATSVSATAKGVTSAAGGGPGGFGGTGGAAPGGAGGQGG